MDLETWQLIAIAGVALLLLGIALWLIFSRGSRTDSNNTLSREEVKRLKSEHAALNDSVESLRDKLGLLEERSERYDRTLNDLRESVSRLEESREARQERFDTVEKSHQELQEQIYELRDEQKVLMKREDRLERRIGELGSTSVDEGNVRSDPDKSSERTTTSTDPDSGNKGTRL